MATTVEEITALMRDYRENVDECKEVSRYVQESGTSGEKDAVIDFLILILDQTLELAMSIYAEILAKTIEQEGSK